jgi:hypothetical protein
LLAKRHHERAVGVVFSARPFLDYGLRQAEGLRADWSALRIAREHDHLAAREPDLDRSGLDVFGRLNVQSNRIWHFGDEDRERAGRGAWTAVGGGVATIAGSSLHRRQKHEQHEHMGRGNRVGAYALARRRFRSGCGSAVARAPFCSTRTVASISIARGSRARSSMITCTAAPASPRT